MDIVYAIGLILLGVLLIIIGPVLTIWSLNTLFPGLSIPYTWQTWLAALLLAGVVAGNGYYRSRD